MPNNLFDSQARQPAPTRQFRLFQYGIAVLAVTCAALAIHYLPIIGEWERGALLVFFFANILVTLWLGINPGGLSLSLSLIGINSLLLIPVWSSEPYDALFLNTGFCLLSVVIIVLIHHFHRQTQALHESQQDMNLAQEVAQVGSWRFKVKGNELSWSDEKYRIFEIAVGTKVTIDTFFSTIHPEDREYVDQMWQASLRGEPYDIEHRIIVTGGRVKWIREKATLKFAKDGALLGGFGTTQDITERKKSDQEMQALIERYELVLNGAQDAIWDWDVPNKRVNYSSRWKALRGYAEDEVGTDEAEWSANIHPDDKAHVMAAVQNHFDGITPSFCEEYRIKCKDGIWKWILDRGIAKRDPSGQIIRMAGSENDITDRKNTEIQLLERENQLNLIMNLTPALISYLDTDFRYLRANKTYEDWFDITVKDMIGHTVRKIVGEDTWKFADPHLKRARNGETATYENKITFYNNVSRWVKASFVPDKDSNGKVKGIVVHVADIEERKRHEQKMTLLNNMLLQKTEELQAIFDTAPIGLCIANDTEAKHIRGNPVMEQLLGLPPSSELSLGSLSPPPIRVFIDGYEPSADELPMQRSGRGETINNQSLELYRPDGQIIELLGSTAPLFDAKGKPRGAVGAFIDVTTLKNTELALRKSEERLRLAQTAGGVGIYDHNLVTGEIQWDTRLLEMWGLKPDQPVTLATFMASLHPDDHAMVKAAVKQSLDPKGSGEYHAEYRVIRSDQRIIWVAAFGVVNFADNQAVRLVGFVQDISERKHAENLLRDTETRLSLAVKELKAGYWDWNLDTNEVFFSPEWKHQLGYTDNEVTNRFEEWEIRLHPDDKPNALTTVENYLNGNLLNFELEFRLQHKDGSYRWIHSRAALMKDHNRQQRRLVGIHLDITDYTRSKELNQQRNKMEEAFQLYVASQTVAAIAHDLNQPLTAISYFADAAVDMVKSGNQNPQKLSRVLENCSLQAQRAGQVIRQLFSILQKGNPQNEAVDINKMVNYAYEYIKMNNQLNSFSFELNLAAGLPPVLANTLQIQKILINIIHNSLEAMHESGNSAGTISVTTCLSTYDPWMAQITVKDTGVGVPDVDALSNMFQPFYTTKTTGLGMGLAISRALIEAHGGKMWAEKNAETGISVHFTLPFML